MAAFKEIDKGWHKLKKELGVLDGSYVAVGYPKEKPKIIEASFFVASLAAVHEFGSIKRKIPSRPFMRKTFKRELKNILKLRQVLYEKVLDGKLRVSVALSRLGAWYVGQIKNSFTSESFQALKKKTIARKGSSKPLIDTGRLRNSATYKVFMK